MSALDQQIDTVEPNKIITAPDGICRVSQSGRLTLDATNPNGSSEISCARNESPHTLGTYIYHAVITVHYLNFLLEMDIKCITIVYSNIFQLLSKMLRCPSISSSKAVQGGKCVCFGTSITFHDVVPSPKIGKLKAPLGDVCKRKTKPILHTVWENRETTGKLRRRPWKASCWTIHARHVCQ